MTQSWSPPPLQPFQRLRVTDGLLMNAQRWRLAHEYHRQQHHFQYQALQEPGIIYGLGVQVINPPEQVRSQYRDGRWLEVQPGMAIDPQGNFIVVMEPISFRLASENFQATPLTVYLVIRHVDPETLHHQAETALLQESFRLDEKATPPQENEVELCRLTLPPHTVEEQSLTLKAAADVFAPQDCEPNFLGRLNVRSRPQGSVRLGMTATALPPEGQNPFFPLVEQLDFIYPRLRAELVSQEMVLNPDAPPRCDLLCAALTPELADDAVALGAMRAYIETGGTLFFEPQGWSNDCTEQLTVYRELQQAIAEATDDPELAPARVELVGEFKAIQTQLVQQLLRDYPALSELGQQFHCELTSVLAASHPVRCQPFRFDLLPVVEGVPTLLAVGLGWIVSLGQLSSAWQPNRPYPLSQQTIRATQELGVNLLHFAWRRRQLTQWQQTAPQDQLPASTPAIAEAVTHE